MKLACKDQKLPQLQGTCNLFGWLLHINTVQYIDLPKMFTYPLVPFPLSLAHVDDTMNKTDKAKLMHKLEGISDSTPPESVDATFVNAEFMMHP